MLRRSFIGACAALAAVLLVSCGSRPVGYGVVLWGEYAGAPATGAVVAVLQESTINSSYLISIPGQKTRTEYPKGRLRFFKKRADAEAFASAYAASLGSWAVAVKEDPPPLPIRAAANPDAKVVYKLQNKQMVKVVSRAADKVTIKPYTDYWYEVLTEDGYSGWCFGHFLKPFSAEGDPRPEAQRILSQDENLARIMGTTWRPAWFLDQIAKGAIDLTMLRDDVGLFPSPSEKVMKLVLPLSTFEFTYTGDPQKVGSQSYSFPGTDLRIDVLDDERIAVTYHYKNQLTTAPYVMMKDDVTQIIMEEQQRRMDLFAALVAKGSTLASSAYGTIRLQDGMRFAWSGFGKLVPSLIPAEAKGKGAVDFDLHVAKELVGSYDGVISFLFDEAPAKEVSFLYQSTSTGLRLTSLGPNSVQDLFVTGPSASPVVIFFSRSP